MRNRDFLASELLDGYTLGGSWTTDGYSVMQYNTFSVQYTVTNASSLDGYFSVEVSLDNSNWHTAHTSDHLTANTSVLTSIYDMPFNFIRFKYARTGGTGNLTALMKCVE